MPKPTVSQFSDLAFDTGMTALFELMAKEVSSLKFTNKGLEICASFARLGSAVRIPFTRSIHQDLDNCWGVRKCGCAVGTQLKLLPCATRLVLLHA